MIGTYLYDTSLYDTTLVLSIPSVCMYICV